MAVRDVGFALERGEKLAIIGPNGAGKTTLLSMLAGVLVPTSGAINRAVERPCGWVPQQQAVYSKLSVAENLRLFARLERLADPDAAVARMLAQTGLEDRAQEQVGRLSGGNQQRVNVAIGLLADPAVLLLDEPTASLDPRQRARLWELISALAGEGRCVLYSTHAVTEAERYADRVLVLGDGEQLFLGTPTELEEVVAGDLAPSAIAPPGPSDGPAGDFETAFVQFLRARGH